MRQLPDALQVHLDSGATTLCWCWKVVRKDGAELGFTDHDNDLVFDAVKFEATSGFSASDTRQAVGLNVDNSDIDGALQSDRISDTDLADGLYDDAQVELFRVNWNDVEQRILMRVGTIGEVTRDGHAFRAEVRGLAHVLGQQQGRLYQRTCDADLGDNRCGVNLSTPEMTAFGTVFSVDSPSRILSNDIGDFPSGWFDFGSLRWTGGANAGRHVQIKAHRMASDRHVIHLWEPMRGGITDGDSFAVSAGCDKRIQTCTDKFANAANFRGFPHLPGASYVTFYPNSDDPR